MSKNALKCCIIALLKDILLQIRTPAFFSLLELIEKDKNSCANRRLFFRGEITSLALWYFFGCLLAWDTPPMFFVQI